MRMKQSTIKAIKTARKWLEKGPIYLDTETTGISNTAQIIDLAVIDTDGTVLLDTLVKPTVAIEKAASNVHGIKDNSVEDAPGFDDIMYSLIFLSQERSVIIYNAEFDRRLIQQSAEAHNIDPPSIYVHCAMVLYAQFYGYWNDYYGNYRWQSQAKAAKQLGLELPEDLHRAKADAQLCRLILEAMAATKLPEEAE